MAVSMVALCALAGFAVDVGLLYHQHRKQQAVADAAAFAGAYDLPGNTGSATSDAQSNASTNGGSASTITYRLSIAERHDHGPGEDDRRDDVPEDLRDLDCEREGDGDRPRREPVDRVRGRRAVRRHQHATPAGRPGCPCFGVSTTLDLNKVGPGGFGIINIDGSSGGTSPGTLAGWITGGCSCSTTVPVWLNSDPGAKFNSSQVQNAMDGAIGRTLLFPVYDAISGNGANLAYHVIGFAGFKVTGWTAKGNNATISGSFQKVDWTASAPRTRRPTSAPPPANSSARWPHQPAGASGTWPSNSSSSTSSSQHSSSRSQP